MTMRANSRRTRHAFTLIELMIVLIILVSLAALVTPAFLKKAEKAKYQGAQVQVKLLANAVNDFFLDVGEYPKGLNDLVQSPGGDRWDGPYLDPPQVPKDPWGEEYHYVCPGQHGKFDLSSYGADKAPGGEKYDADINSWEVKP